MRKRVLIAEESDTIRGVAETLLRQNGFEVISVKSGLRAQEVVGQTRPDLIIVGGELTSTAGRPLYDAIQSETRVTGVPLLLFCDPGDKSLPFPEEVIIPRPFDADEFVEKVMVFSGQSERPAGGNPLESASLDDELLDAALGLDRIDVTDSEVMSRSSGVQTSHPRHGGEHFVGLHSHVDETTPPSRKVETVHIRDGSGAVPQQKDKPEVERIGTQKLDLLNDLIPTREDHDTQHDYEWFINEMKQDVQKLDTGAAPPRPKAPLPPPAPEDALTFSEPSSMVDPHTPAPASAAPAAPVEPRHKSKSGGVEKFIDEFKKEIEKFHSEELEGVEVKTTQSGKIIQQPKSSMEWEDSVESVTPQQIGIFKDKFINALAEKLADRIASKIDADKLLRLLRDEIVARQNRK